MMKRPVDGKKLKKMIKQTIKILWLSSLCTVGAAQVPNIEGAQALVLKDQTEVVLLPAKGCEHCYYYVPANFRVSRNEAKEAELSLLKISESENSPVIGGILHVLFVWGYDASQHAELEQLIGTHTDSLGVLLGATSVEESPDAPGIKITGDDALAKVLRSGLKSSSGVATTPGSKMAMSFRFNEAEMKELQKALDDPKLDSKSAFEINLSVLVDTEHFMKRYPLALKVKLADLLKLIR